MASALGGVIGKVVTPMHADDEYSLNEDAPLRRHGWTGASTRAATGINATPSIGEFPHLSTAERVRCMEVTLEQVRQHGGTALATSSGVTTLQTLELTRIAADMGYDYAVVIAPYYWKLGEVEVKRHFFDVADKGGLPVNHLSQPGAEQVSPAAEIRRRTRQTPEHRGDQRG